MAGISAIQGMGASISAIQGMGAKPLVSQIVRTDLGRLILCEGKYLNQVKYVFRGGEYYL